MPEDPVVTNAKDIIKELFCIQGDVKLKSCKRVDEGQGYMSIVSAAEPDYQAMGIASEGKPERVILKVPTMEKMTGDVMASSSENPEDAKIEMVINAHNIECDIYTYLKSAQKIIPIAAPNIFGAAKRSREVTGYLAMEDWSVNGKMPDFVKGMNLEQCYQVMEMIAAVQTVGLVDSSWRKFVKPMPDDFCQDFASSAEPSHAKLLEDYPEIYKVELEDVLKISSLEVMMSILKPNDKKTMLVHGDLWANNIFFKTDENGKVTDTMLGFIDWQLAHIGLPTEDIARFLAASLTADFRRKHTPALLKRYHDTLVKLTAEKGVDCLFTLAEIEADYKRTIKYGASFFQMQAADMLRGHLDNESEEDRRQIAWRATAGVIDAARD